MSEASCSPYQRGLSAMREVYAGEIIELPEGTLPFNDVMLKTLFAEVWTRNVLSMRDRRLLLLGVVAARGVADEPHVDAAQREEILTRYREHSRRFQTVAARRTPVAELIEFPPRTPAVEPEHSPTAREIEVLQLVSEGLANREIGDRLFLSEETVKSHVRSIFRKLEVGDRTSAVAVAGLAKAGTPARIAMAAFSHRPHDGK